MISIRLKDCCKTCKDCRLCWDTAALERALSGTGGGYAEISCENCEDCGKISEADRVSPLSRYSL